MSSVKVAVRVRPFDEREKKLNSVCVIEVEDKKIRLSAAKASNALSSSRRDEVKEFTYDHSYWSHDHTHGHFITQEDIYNDIGAAVVQNVLEGYNACVFAYGQTGSGKTYTMMGSKSDPGLIPRICETLFNKIEEGRETGSTYKVQVSYLEIYNEKVRDLLRPLPKKCSSLRVREDVNHRPFVENLSHHNVRTYPDIEKLIDAGNIQRTTAATKMNDTSSRSHAIFTVTFTQAKLEGGTPIEMSSKINLVDLAGSERVAATGAEGDILQEGSHINKSLVTLGLVISNLAEKSKKTQKEKSIHIPYRNSNLTWLLKDSLGGNSKTMMIATVSPASVNHGESLSTLYYANRAKRIVNKPTVNEDPKTKLIRQLREEIARLLSVQEKLNTERGVSSKSETIMEELIDKQAKEKQLTDQWTEKWRQTQEILQEQKTLGLKKTGESGHGVTLYSDRPHVVVVDSKVYPGGVSVFNLNEGINSVGTSETQDIHLEGLGILTEHCSINLAEDGVYLEPKNGAEIYLDGNDIKERTPLKHGHTLLLGANNVLRFNDPDELQLMAECEIAPCPAKKNLRDSFLSRSTMDLFRSQEEPPSRTMDSSKMSVGTPQDDLCLSSQIHRHDDTSYCEMATQTSLNSSHSQPNSPISEQVPSPVDVKSSLSLPLEKYEENMSSSQSDPSINSTPASDTFYTATSVLTPDPSEILSPFPDDSSVLAPQTELTSPIHPVCSGLLNRFNSPGALFSRQTSTPVRGNSDTAIQEVIMSASPKLISSVERTVESALETRPVREEVYFDPLTSPEVSSEKSELVSCDEEILAAFKVIDRIEQNHLKNMNFEEQLVQHKRLHEHYTKLEDTLITDLREGKLSTDARYHDYNKENTHPRPNCLPVDDKILKEERIALLIEMEIERRVAEEMKRRSNQVSEFPERLVRSISPNAFRMLQTRRHTSLADIRPYSSLSDGCDYDALQTASSFDDFLLSPSHSTQSPLGGDFDMSCGICVSVPSFEQRGAGSSTHWEYEIRLTAGCDAWTVFRRYRRFRELHIYMCHKFGPVIEEIYFPPRRIFGNNSERVIEERRGQLEVYLQQLIIICSDLEGSPLCDVRPTRKLLESFSPFFQQGVFEVGRHVTS